MRINISCKHMELTAPIEEYIRRKAEKLSRFYDRIQQVDVILATIPNGDAVEILTDVERHEDFIANCESPDLYACIDGAVDREIRQLSDHKERTKNHHPH